LIVSTQKIDALRVLPCTRSPYTTL